MNTFWQTKQRVMAPADDNDSGGGEAVIDRGDTLEPAIEAETKDVVDPMLNEKKAEVIESEDDESDEDADEKVEKTKKGAHIPTTRHKALLEKERAKSDALQAELDRVRGAENKEVNETVHNAEKNLLQLETQYNKLLADGEIEKATSKMTEIRRLERSINEYMSDAKTQRATEAAVERVRYDTILDRLESAYPEINPDSADYDEATYKDVIDLFNAFSAKGDIPSLALQKSVKFVLGATTAKERAATEVTPRASKEVIEGARKAAAVGRNISAAKGTPPLTNKIGLNSDEKGGGLTPEGLMKMSQSDFAKLGEKDLSRLRGDEL